MIGNQPLAIAKLRDRIVEHGRTQVLRFSKLHRPKQIAKLVFHGFPHPVEFHGLIVIPLGKHDSRCVPNIAVERQSGTKGGLTGAVEIGFGGIRGCAVLGYRRPFQGRRLPGGTSGNQDQHGQASLEIILELGNRTVPQAEKERLAALKNSWYVDYISRMEPGEVLPGAVDFLTSIRKKGIRTALGSASKNTPMILERTGISALFDAVADGNNVQKAKPDPEVFLKAASLIGVDPGSCVVFEDAAAGVEAALNAGMKCVGIGSADILSKAHVIIKGLHEMTYEKLLEFEK